MRHRKKRNKLSRDAAHREALLSNLSKQLIEHERIKTSQAKAKAVKPEVEQLITLAKRGDLHARRQALATLHNDKFIVHKLFDEVAPRYADAARRLHPDRQAGSEAVGLDRDGLPRAGLAGGGRGPPADNRAYRPDLSIRRSGAPPLRRAPDLSVVADRLQVQAVGWSCVACR